MSTMINASSVEYTFETTAITLLKRYQARGEKDIAQAIEGLQKLQAASMTRASDAHYGRGANSVLTPRTKRTYADTFTRNGDFVVSDNADPATGDLPILTKPFIEVATEFQLAGDSSKWIANHPERNPGGALERWDKNVPGMVEATLSARPNLEYFEFRSNGSFERMLVSARERGVNGNLNYSQHYDDYDERFDAGIRQKQKHQKEQEVAAAAYASADTAKSTEEQEQAAATQPAQKPDSPASSTFVVVEPESASAAD